jgi:hypothetical protein
VALLDEVADSEGILVDVTAGEALVGHVEEGEVVLLLHNLGDLLPLLLGRVNASGVVSAGVEEEDTAERSGKEVSLETLEVEADGLLVVVAVLLNLEAGIGEDSLVVGPRRGGNEDLLVARVEALKESGTNAQSASAGDGLSDGDTVKDRRVGAVGQLSGKGRELGDTGDSGVLLVQLGVDDLELGLANGGQNVWLALVISVGTNTCRL